ncbi:MAG: hypothetical protein IKL69_00065 [Paludibacteraceae bacterium]|nr:hypothetical protein [Paludibacteraceae bacterium]
MRKLLLFITLIFCSLGAVAQECQSYENTNFKQVKVLRPSDNSIQLDWQYVPVTEDVVFEISYHAKGNADVNWFRVPVRHIRAIDPLGCKKDAEGECEKDSEGNAIMEDLTPNQVYTTTIYDLDLTGAIVYRLEIKVLKGSSEIEEVYIFEDNNGAKAIQSSAFDCATIYEFTYGLEWANPATTNPKSSSVTLNWEKHKDDNGNYLYQVFGVKHDVLLATTATTSATITNLELGEHRFIVRAFEEGVYKASTDECVYKAEQVDCVTFPTVTVDKNTITLTILGYDGDEPFSKDVKDYTLISTDGEGTWTKRDNKNGNFSFTFSSIDLSKGENEFKLETTKTNDVKAIGLFRLDTDGSLLEQYCDIVFELNVTHVTTQTATLEWGDPGFVATNAYLTVKKKTGASVVVNKEINPKVKIYAMDGLESGVDYVFELKLTDGYNQSKATAQARTKVASICGLENMTNGATWIGCGNGTFLMPYDLEFYTAYKDEAKKTPYVVVRFRPRGTQQISDVTVYATTERGTLADAGNLTSAKMTLGADGWYTCELDEYSYLIFWKRPITNDLNMRFSVSVKHNQRCEGKLWFDNTYFTKFASYKVGTGCQDDIAVKTLTFTKLYPEQSQFTLQSNGRLASVGVFPNDKYNENERIFYNSFDDAPTHFTLDITDYEPGTYYLHIHDVYGEANSDAFKCIWAIY